MDEFCCGYGSDEYCPTCGVERPDYVDPSLPPVISLRQYNFSQETRTAIDRERYKNDAVFRDRMRKAASDWARNNPGKAKAKVKRREARKRGAEVSDLTLDQWKQILSENNDSCFYCGIKAEDTPQGWLTQEHLTPLSRGGDHTWTNVKPACQSCNSKKGQQTAEEFLLKG